MDYQYITNKTGTPIALVVPIQEWENLQSRLKEEYLRASAINNQTIS